jgi:plasmid stabilization system protein ParE
MIADTGVYAVTEDQPATRRRFDELSSVKRQLLRHRLLGEAPAPPEGAQPRPATTRSPDRVVSADQRHIWFMEQLAGDRPVYHVPLILTWPDRVDAAILGRCLTEIVRRHEVLRCRLRISAGRLTAQVAEASPVIVTGTELTAESELPAELRSECSTRFDLSAGPLLRARVFRVPRHGDTVAVTAHHVAFDGWSTGILIGELLTLYRAFGRSEPSPLPEPTMQYDDFARLQERQWADRGFTDALAYWEDTLSGAPAVSTFPPSRARPATPGYHGRHIRYDFDPALRLAVSALAARAGVTPFMVMTAAVAVVLARHAGTDDVLIGTVVAGRDLPESIGLIGCFAHPVVLRIRLGESATVQDLLDRTRSACVAAFEHGHVPFERLVDHLRPARGPGAPPFFQVMLAQQDTGLDRDGVRVRGLDLGVAAYDVTFFMEWAEDDARLVVEYDAEAFTPDAMTEVVDDCDQVLRHFTEHPHGTMDDLGPPAFARVPAPAPAASTPAPVGHGPVDPRDIAAVWAQVLGLPAAETTASFFDLGGNSLQMVEARARLESQLRLRASLLDLYTYPTAAALAAHLSGRPADPASAPAATDGAALRAAAAQRRARRTGEHGDGS